MCGDPLADLFLMLGITVATPASFALFWHTRKKRRTAMTEKAKLR